MTVSRFRAFLAYYPASLPTAGSGRNHRNALDHGWQDEWTTNLPPDQVTLKGTLDATGCGGRATWAESGNEDLPINCVSWYLAQAFCIWDGGRLPTEAEWDYVAAGGEENRYYPWSSPSTDTTIDATYANYASSVGGPTPVGQYTKGAGKWGHLDLAGNLTEWVWDGYQSCYVIPTGCDDCGATEGYEQKVQKGGSYVLYENALAVQYRGGARAETGDQFTGFRCAHDF